MNRKNRVISSSVIVLLLAIAVYLGGCASAEINSGKIAFQEKNYEKAAVELRKGVQKDSADAEAWYMLGYSLKELNRLDEASVALRKSLSLSNVYAPNIQQFYVDFFNSGINKFNDASKLYSTDSAGAVAGFIRASEDFEFATTLFPDSLDARQLMADTYFFTGRIDDALSIYDNSILNKISSQQKAIETADILYDAGRIQMNAGKYENAGEIFNRVISISQLPRDNEFYEVSVYNAAAANIKIAERLSNENGDFKPYLNNAIDILEPFVERSTNTDRLKESYELLLYSYASLNMQDKYDAAKVKLEALGQ